jgi:hypothetical protein
VRLIPIKGAEHVKRGANNKWHTGNISGQQSRGYNAIEAGGVTIKLEHKLDEAVERLHELHSKRFLKYYRKLIAGYKTHNHVIEISANMGDSTIKVNGNLLQDYYSRGMFTLLYEIEQTMNWEWSAYLDGEKLN